MGEMRDTLAGWYSVVTTSREFLHAREPVGHVEEKRALGSVVEHDAEHIVHTAIRLQQILRLQRPFVAALPVPLREKEMLGEPRRPKRDRGAVLRLDAPRPLNKLQQIRPSEPSRFSQNRRTTHIYDTHGLTPGYTRKTRVDH
jgi:hypothetical protein